MKKSFILISIMLLSFMANSLNAQNYVSTDPQNRNALIEEYTGVNCPNCPAGHMIANSLVLNNPDRVWAVNIHAGYYATSAFNSSIANAIYNGFSVTSFPSAIINRQTTGGISRDQWGLYVEDQMKQAAECNIGGQVRIDPATRTASVTVEVYYTDDSESETNYLNVMMLQDSIMAYQSGSETNSSQIVNGTYCHMHVLRAAVTPTWGDAITPTTKGSLITKTYEFPIPATIGSFDVDLDNILFIAFVTEKYEGTPTMPILNVNELYSFQGTTQNVYPNIISVGTSSKFSCSDERVVNVSLNNGGLDAITKLEFDVTVDNGETLRQVWEGEIPSYQTANVEINVAVPEGTHDVVVKLVKANGVDFESTHSFTMTNEPYSTYMISGTEEEFTIQVNQDKYGNEITWELLASDYSVLASGGPYEFLSGSTADKLNEHKVTISANECVKFVIKDSKGNGICCRFGEGYYKVLDSKGNVVIDGDGEFGSEASYVISVVTNEDVTENVLTDMINAEIYPNPTNGNLNVKAESMKRISVINTLGQVVYDNNVDGDSETIDMSQYKAGLYMVRIMTENGIVTKRVSVTK